jgi:hypothetical protein
MSREQLENFAFGRADRLSDDRELWDWLPHVAQDVSDVEVGLWRCAHGDEGEESCWNDTLWESPFDWSPRCGWCGRKAALVEYVGSFNFADAIHEQERERLREILAGMTPEERQRLLGEFPEDEDE